MSALVQIPEHFTTQFDANWRHLVQQKNSRLREYVTLDSISGKEKSYNQLSEAAMQLITSRSGETRISDQATAKRWIRPKAYDTAKLFDEFDEQLLGEVVLPTSPVVQSHAQAYARTADQVIIDALGGSAYTGETGVTATALPAGQKVAKDYVETGSTANSGLTIAKLRAAKYILDSNEVDEEEERIIVVSAKQLQDLLQTVQVTSVDYNSVKALVDGNVNTFMGFKFRRSQLLPLNTSTDIRSAYVYVKSGIVLAERGLKTHMDVRTDLSHSLQIRSVASLGATRLEEKKIVEIACDESP
jgi:Phage capsid protein